MSRESNLDKQLVRAAVADALFGTDAVRGVRLGEYQLIRMVGRGAMGTVFEGCHLTTKHRRALKVLHEFGGPAIYRIKREFRSLAGVVHPNLVALHELYKEDGRWFFTMELVVGVPFDRWIREAQTAHAHAHERRLRLALADLVTGVHAIHQAGKLHRDLKPANVLVTEDGTLKILDYGLMSDKVLDGWRAESAVVGTPAYMAPEALAGERSTEAGDWYSVGVMLFEALTGALPHDGPPLQLMRLKQGFDAPRADTLRSGLPSDLVNLAAALLQRAPGDRPTSQQILEAAGAPGAVAESRSSAGLQVLVGRTDEVALAQGALWATATGVAQVVLFGGPSGIGKTALLEGFLSGDHGALVLAGRCYQQESVPYKVFDVVMDALARHLRQLSSVDVERVLPRHLHALEQLFPVLRGLSSRRTPPAADMKDSFEQRKLAFGALKELLLRLSDQVAIIVAVDDLQWGDADSILMLRHLFAGSEPPPILFLGTYRSDEAADNEFLQHLLDSRTFGSDVRLRTRQLSPLRSEAAVELVKRLASCHTSAATAQAIVNESGGVPLLLVELIKHLEARQAARSGQPVTSSGASLHELVQERVAALPTGAQRLLDLVSLASGPLEESVLERAAELHAGASTTLQSLRAARLVRVRRGRHANMVEVYHDRIRAAVVSRLTPAERSVLHGQLARALDALGIEGVERLIPHYLGFGDRRRAGEAALQAGAAAAHKLAFNHAAELFECAIELLPTERVRETQLHTQLADALANAGRGARAAGAYLSAAAEAPPDRANQLERRAAQQYLRSGRTKEGWPLARRVLARTGVRVPHTQAATTAALLWERTKLRVRGTRQAPQTSDAAAIARLEALRDLAPELAPHHLVTGALLQTRYLNEALKVDRTEHTLQALAWEVYNASVMGGPRNELWAAEALEAVIDLGGRMGTPYARGLTQFAQSARLLFTARHFRDASVPALDARKVFAQHCPGAIWEQNVMSFFHLVCLEFTGPLHEQVARANEALQDATERDDQFLARLMVLSVPYSYLVRDQPEAALTFLTEAERFLDRSYATERILWLFRMTDALMYVGRASEALELFNREWQFLRTSHIFGSLYIRYDAHYFRARCALAAHAESGQREPRKVAVEDIRCLRAANGAFGACGQALSAGLAVSTRQGKHLLEQALERLTQAQAPLLATYVERRLNEWRGNDRGTSDNDLALQKQGVVNPERWLWTHMPIRPEAIDRRDEA